MANALTMIKPHEVSRDLRGYSVMFYGTAKSGKTTTASKFPGALILGFEKGWNALPGVMAIGVNSWREFKNYLIMLKDDETKAMYQTIVIDTADIAYDYCVDYICNQNDVDTIGDLAYGKGYSLVAKEFDTCLRKILQLDYGLVLISHSTDRVERDEKGNEYTRLEPTLDKRGRLICERTCDIIGLSRPTTNEDGSVTTKLFMRETPRFVAGSRFKYLDPVIEFTYDNLVDAIHRAIDKEAELTGHQYVTETKANTYQEAETDIPPYEDMRAEASQLIGTLMEKDPNNRMKISKIVSNYLGAKKFADATEKDADQVYLILQELRRL